MALARPTNHTTPAFGNELGLDTTCLQSVFEAAVHAWHREPHLRFLELQQWLQLWQPESFCLNKPFRPTADDSVEVSLHFQQHSERYVVLVLWSQRAEQVSMPLPVGNVHRAFATGVLVGAPSTETDQLLDHRDWGTVPGSLVQRGVPGRSARSGTVDQVLIFRYQLDYTDQSPHLAALARACRV